MANLKNMLIEKSKRFLRIFVLSLVIGVVVGYLAFHLMMPSVVVPQTTNPSLPMIGLILLMVGLLVGALSEDLEATAIQMLLGVIVGVFISWLLFISPSSNPEIIIPGASGYIYNVLHAALPVIFLALAMLFIGGFIGTTVMESMAGKASPSLFETAAAAMKKKED